MISFPSASVTTIFEGGEVAVIQTKRARTIYHLLVEQQTEYTEN